MCDGYQKAAQGVHLRQDRLQFPQRVKLRARVGRNGRPFATDARGVQSQDGGYQTSPSPRTEPAMTSSHPTPARCQWFSRLASALDRRSAPRLALLFLGAVLARGRRTVTSWIRAAGLSGQYQSCYLAVAAAGKKAETIAAYLVLTVVEPLLGGVERLMLAL